MAKKQLIDPAMRIMQDVAEVPVPNFSSSNESVVSGSSDSVVDKSDESVVSESQETSAPNISRRGPNIVLLGFHRDTVDHFRRIQSLLQLSKGKRYTNSELLEDMIHRKELEFDEMFQKFLHPKKKGTK